MAFREYEIRNKPLFASMKRAKSALSKVSIQACTVDYFFDYLESYFGEETVNVDFITFYDYFNFTDNHQYRIAYIYTLPNISFREQLFEQKEAITLETGWYPMVSGKRAHFTLLKDMEPYWKVLKQKPPYVHLGKPISIKNVACDISSTSLLLHCERGNILLDTGFQVEQSIINDIHFVFISHFHKDHTGGLFSLLKQRDVPVILSDITLDYLLSVNGIEESDRDRLIRNAVLVERLTNNTPINQTLEFFDCYHCPGAYGLKYIFNDNCFVYPGDFCLGNGFYDYYSSFYDCVKNDCGKTTIVTDCALVPRGNFSITDQNYNTLSSSIRSNNNCQVFLSRTPELLFNIYVRIFRMNIEAHKDWLFIVSDELYSILQSVLRTWILPKHNGDPYIRHVLGKTGINFAETWRLFPVSSAQQFVGLNNNRLLLFLSIEDLDPLKDVINYANSDLYITGPLALSKNVDDLIDNYAFRSINKLSSPDWSFHSDKDSIKQMICTKSTQNEYYYLFHAFPRDLKRFIRELPPEYQERVNYISKKDVLFKW